MSKKTSKNKSQGAYYRHTRGRGPSQRQLRAGELIRHALVDILMREDLRDPRLEKVSITISEVRPSPDLRQASVYCMPLGASTQMPSSAPHHTNKLALANIESIEHEDEIIAALNEVAPYLRGILGRKIDLKFTPTLIFRKDESFIEASRIEALLSSPAVAKDLRNDDD